MVAKEFENVMGTLKDATKYLNKYGYTLAIIRIPRAHSFVRMYDPATRVIDDKTRFGKTKIKQLREEAGLSIYELAAEMGVDKTIVRRIEDSDMTHTYKSMKRFADYFGCSIEELLADD